MERVTELDTTAVPERERSAPVRIGVWIDASMQPRWVATLLEGLHETPGLELVAAIRSPPPPRARKPTLYERLDGFFFSSDSDALALWDVSAPLRDCLSLDVGGDADWETVRAAALDVILVFRQGDAAPLDVARFGFWRVRVGTDGIGAREVAARYPTTEAVLERIDGPGLVLDRAVAVTHPISLRRGLDRLYWKVVARVISQLQRVHADARLTAHADARLTSEQSRKGVEAKSGVASLLLPLTVAGRYAAQSWRDKMLREQWFLATRVDAGERPLGDLTGFRPLLPPPDRLWADPFVIMHDGRVFLFFEEMLYGDERGRIAMTEIRQDGGSSEPTVVLERPYHLSYPCTFAWNGGYYMLPETMANGTIELYRAHDFPHGWERCAVLMDDVRAVDSTLFEVDGHWWMYTTVSAGSDVFDELLLFHAPTPLGPWQAHPANPLISDPAGGRCGGRPFRRDGRLYRAAQNGTGRYGRAMQLREIVTLTPDTWKERVVAELLPDWHKGLIGTHTFNVCGPVTVIDGARMSWRRRT